MLTTRMFRSWADGVGKLQGIPHLRSRLLQEEGILSPERYAGSGTITSDTKMVEASGVLGVFDTEEVAQLAGLGWARASVDNLG
jgi:hypothetical protein